jgi:hypothetical protein
MKSLARDGDREPCTTGRAGAAGVGAAAAAAGAAGAAGKTVVEAMTGQ